jgi:hypothetical protein
MGRIDVLLNNAGFAVAGFETNCFGQVARAVIGSDAED